MKRGILIFILLLVTTMLLPLAGCGDDTAKDQGVLAAATDKLYDAGTYTSEMDFQMIVDVSGPDIDEQFSDILPIELGMQARADMDMSDYDKQKARLYDISIDGTRDIFMLMMEESGEPAAAGHMLDGFMKQMLKDVEMIVYEEDVYIYFGDQWYEFSAEEMANMPDSGVDADEMECLMGVSSETLSYNDTLQLMDDLYVDVKDKGSEDIDGVSTTRYVAAIDGSEAARFLEDYMDDYYAELEKCSGSSMPDAEDEDFQEMMDAMGEMMEGIAETVTIETWIDEEGYPRQQLITIEFDDEDVKQMLDAVEPGSSEDFEKDITYLDVRMEIKTKNSRIGEDVEVERPDDAVSFMQLMEDLEDSFGGSSGTDSWNG